MYMDPSGCPRPTRPREARSATRYAFMLPTIDEDESFDECSMVGSSPSETSLSWYSDLSAPSGSPHGLSDDAQSAWQQGPFVEAGEGVVTGNCTWQLEQQLDEDELLLAAIEVRLQELVALRERRKAAMKMASDTLTVKAAAGAPTAPPAPVAAPSVPWETSSSSKGHAASAALAMTVPQHHQQPPGADLANCVHNLAMAQQLNDAGRIAMAKLQQMYAVQQMQVVLQQELLEVLQQGY